MVSKDLLKILACPVCKGNLKEVKKGEKEFLHCAKCPYDYPVKEGIPVLLPPELQDKN